MSAQTIPFRENIFAYSDITEVHAPAVPNDLPPYLWNETVKLLSTKTRFALVPRNELSRKLREAISAEMEKLGKEVFFFEVRPLTNCLSVDDAYTSFAPLASWNPDALILCEDESKLFYLSVLNTLPWSRFPSVVVSGSRHHETNLRAAQALEQNTGEVSYAVGYDYLKAHLLELLQHYKRRGMEGDIAELGVYRGGTLLLISEILQNLNFTTPNLIGFDTWDGFPKRRCLLDMYDSDEFDCRDYDQITRKLASRRISLVRGDIVETIRTIRNRKLLLTFIDTDNYTPAKAALPEIAANTVPGGAIVFDHFFAKEEFNNAIGDGVAAMEFFNLNPEFLNLSGTGVFLKI